MTTSGDHLDDGPQMVAEDLDIHDQEIEGLPPFVLNQQAWAEILPPEREVQSAQVTTIASTERRFTLDTNDPRSKKALGDEFKNTARACRGSLTQLGLHRVFGGVLGAMLKETRLMVTVPPADQDEASESEFYIVKERTSKQVERLFLLDPNEVKRDVTRLREAYRTLPFLEVPDRTLPIVGLEWIIGRKIMELAGTACYLRQEYGQFMPGFGGYTPQYMSRRTIALNYLATNTLNPEAFNDPDVETERIINGFGLHWLEKALVRRNMVGNDQEANLVMRAVLKQDRKRLANSTTVTDRLIGAAAALSTEELMERIGAIFPNEQPACSAEAMNALADAIG